MNPTSDEVRRFDELLSLARTLRGEDGCPWDRAQTFQTMRKYLLEETHEVIEAIDLADDPLLAEELGDLFFLVIFYLILGEETGVLKPAGVLENTINKMRRRHPHVFGPEEAQNEQEAFLSWESSKRREKCKDETGSVLDGIPRTLPALTKARRIQERASALGFDWKDVAGPLAKVEEEIEELKHALREGGAAEIEAEIGDLLFSLVNVARLANHDPEAALEGTNTKFTRRFAGIEKKIAQSPHPMSLEEMDKLWEDVKKNEEP